MTVQLGYPLRVRNGRLAQASGDEHVRDMVEQLLFTNPGERVNLPEFGCGLDLLVFEPTSTELVAVTQALVRAALLRWLGDVLVPEQVTIAAAADLLTITVGYVLLGSGDRQAETYVR